MDPNGIYNQLDMILLRIIPWWSYDRFGDFRHVWWQENMISMANQPDTLQQKS